MVGKSFFFSKSRMFNSDHLSSSKTCLRKVSFVNILHIDASKLQMVGQF